MPDDVDDGLCAWSVQRRVLRSLLSLLIFGVFGWMSVACDAGARDCKLQSDCFRGERCVSGECISAELSSDGGVDAPDCRNAEGVCGSLVCDLSTGRCVACDEDVRCGQNQECVSGECRCASGFHLCGDVCVDDTSPNTCGSSCEPCPAGTEQGAEAICRSDGTCGLRCVTGDCSFCEENADCANHPDGAICDGGNCVECTVDERAACGSNSCNPATNTCTTTPVASRGDCDSCVADSECEEAQSRCVPMNFNGNELPDGYCLPLKLGACSSPYPTTVTRPTLSGAPSEVYCAPNEQNTTCEAMADQGIACTENAQCGKRGYSDGLCKLDECTFACDSNEDCFVGDSCCGLYCCD